MPYPAMMKDPQRGAGRGEEDASSNQERTRIVEAVADSSGEAASGTSGFGRVPSGELDFHGGVLNLALEGALLGPPSARWPPG